MSNNTVQIFDKLAEKIRKAYIGHLERPMNEQVTSEQRFFSGGFARCAKEVLVTLEIGRKEAVDNKEITFEAPKEEVKAEEQNTTVSAQV